MKTKTKKTKKTARGARRQQGLGATRRLLGLRACGPFADVCSACGDEGHFAAICPRDDAATEDAR